MQNSTIAADEREVESLEKECEAAKEKAKDTQEKYFSVSDRLNAINDEMHCISFKVLVSREVPFVFVSKMALRRQSKRQLSHLILRGCVSWYRGDFWFLRKFTPDPCRGSVFVYLILPEDLVIPERVIPVWVHPQFLHREENFIPVRILQHHHVIKERPLVSASSSG